MSINGVGVSLVVIGSFVAYAAVKGKSLTDTVRQTLNNEPSALITGTSINIPGGGGVGSISFDHAGNAAARVVSLAESQLGKPYVFATPLTPLTANPASFDCSGLVMWCYYQAGTGILLGHYSPTQYLQLAHRPLADAQPGDVIFYSHTGSGATAYHCAICIGANRLIEAADVGIPVRVRQYSISDGDIVQTVGVCP